MLICFQSLGWSSLGFKQTAAWFICWLRPAAEWRISSFTRLINFNSRTLIRLAFNSGFRADPYNSEWCENESRPRSVQACVCVYAAVWKASGGLKALHRVQAWNLCKQSSGHNDSPAKRWISHQPQLNHAQTHEYTATARQSEKAMQTWL